MKFFNLIVVTFQNCNLNDDSLYSTKNLFSQNLFKLNLSNNKFTDIAIFNNEEVLCILNELDLSFNNIIYINCLVYCKLTNLHKLRISAGLFLYFANCFSNQK